MTRKEAQEAYMAGKFVAHQRFHYGAFIYRHPADYVARVANWDLNTDEICLSTTLSSLFGCRGASYDDDWNAFTEDELIDEFGSEWWDGVEE